MIDTKLSDVERKILTYYQRIGHRDSSLGRGLRFCVRLRTTAAAVGCSTKTVARANKHLEALAILMWGRNTKGLLEYALVLAGIRGHELVGVHKKHLQAVRRQLKAFQKRSNFRANLEVLDYTGDATQAVST